MASVFISKEFMFDLFESNNFKETPQLMEGICKLIEEKLELKLIRPFNDRLLNEIRAKLVILEQNWSKCDNLWTQSKFRKECKSGVYKVNISTSDLEQDLLAREYEQYKFKCTELTHENNKLESNLRGLRSELSFLKNELIRAETELKNKNDQEKSTKNLKNSSNGSDPNNSLSSTRIVSFNQNQTLRQDSSDQSNITMIFDQNNSQFDAKKSFEVSSSILLNRLDQNSTQKDFRIKQYQIENAKLQEKMKRLMRFTKRKNFFETKFRQQRRLKKEITGILTDSTQFLKNMGLCLSAVEINPIELDNCNVKVDIRHPNQTDYDKPNENNLLYFKDKFSISDKAYIFLRKHCHLNIPTFGRIKKTRSNLDDMFQIKENEFGVFLLIEEKLRFRLEMFFTKKYGIVDDLKDMKNFRDDIIHVKLSADGTQIGRNLKLLNLTFTIINEGNKAKTASGNYTLGIFEIENENYESILKCFKQIIDDIENLNKIKVYNRYLRVIYYYGSDWKMLAHSLGILSANSKYPCIWCKTVKEDFYILDRHYSIIDPSEGARSHEEIVGILNHPESKTIMKYGHEKEPIFRDIIPIHRYVIDMLHLFLRISDSLINLLIKDCCLADNFDMNVISRFDISQYKHLNSFQHFLNEKCNVKFTFLWVSQTKKLNWRDLVGPEKHRLFENFNLTQIIPGHEKFDSVVQLWKEFYSIMQDVKQVKLEPRQVKKRTNDWLILYMSIYNKVTITPYMHAFVAHLHEFVHLYKDINIFNCQGIEKLNDMSTLQFFKGTNKKETAFHQMIKKRNRIEYLSNFIKDNELD